MSDVLRCPSCYQKLAPTDFQCPRCELLLEGHLDDTPAPRNPDSIVRAIMERPQGSVSRKRPVPPPYPMDDDGPSKELPTKQLRLPPPLDQILPRVVAGLTLTEFSLTPFEAFVVGNIDGRTRADQLLALLDLEDIELQVVLTTLEARGVVSLDLPGAPPKPKARPPPPPPQTNPRARAAHASGEPTTQPGFAPFVEAKPALAPEPTPAVKKPDPVLPAPAEVVAPSGGQRATDARVTVGEGVGKNRKILDALKKVKRKDASDSPPEARAAPRTADELAAESVLQVAIRMEKDGRLGEAVKHLERALLRSPDAAPLLNRLAIVLVRDRRDFNEAERLLRRALELAPEHAVYKQNLVTVLAQAARENTGAGKRR